MEIETENKQDEIQNGGAVRDCPDSDGSPVFYDGKDRRGYCAYCVHGLEARDSLEFAPECQGCIWTDAKKNWSPMLDFDKENTEDSHAN